ncbi:MAG: hypothetical protein ACRD4W_13370, partial [Nitrososphaeraceae archaeon]
DLKGDRSSLGSTPLSAIANMICILLLYTLLLSETFHTCRYYYNLVLKSAGYSNLYRTPRMSG